MNPAGFRHLLAPETDPVEKEDQGIQCIDSQMGRHARMGCFSMKFYRKTANRVGAIIATAQVVGVPDQPRLHAIEHAGSLHFDLAAQLFLAGSPEKSNLPADTPFFQFRYGKHSRSDAGNTDEVMSAGMSDPRQSIVLRKKTEVGTVATVDDLLRFV